MVLCEPVQAGLVGGGDAKVSPAVDHEMGQAVAVMVKGGLPESKIGDASLPVEGGALLNFKVAGSIAYCHEADASNSRSTASFC
jgi:hypothetical protein